jgi:CPA1 family monovalent cation:H+ antiporter
MPQFELICFVLMLVAALDLVARKIHLPYPVLMVISGLVLGLIPSLPQVNLPPELVLPIFLPPLLFPAALFTSWRDFRNSLRPIMLLAVGLVLMTMVAVAWVAHATIFDLPWASAFVLGAIVSTPDAIAATSIFQRLEVPRRIVTVLEGESLVNDTVALVAYRFGIVAVLTGQFSLAHAALDLPLVAAGGAAIGGLVGLFADWILRRLDNPPVQVTISLLTPFLAYLPAERFGCSGALAIVIAGVFMGWRLPEMVTARTRLEMLAFWQMLVYLLNGIIFVFIGLRLPQVMEGLGQQSLSRLILQALAITGAIIGVRMLWVFISAYLPRALFAKIRAHDPYPDWRHLFIIAWSGMRGVDSLATALALPFFASAGRPFPGRDSMIFIAFIVILVTLVAQGLSLPLLIRLLKVKGDGKADLEEHNARMAANEAALLHVQKLIESDPQHRHALILLQAQYQQRLAQLASSISSADGEDGEVGLQGSPFRRFALEALQVEYDTLIKLRNKRQINDETLRVVQRDVDLAETRIIEMGL